MEPTKGESMRLEGEWTPPFECLESYIGEAGASEDVKLEEQALITATGALPMSSALFVDVLEL